MVLEVGVDFERLEYWLQRILNTIRYVVSDYGGKSVVITVAYEGAKGLEAGIFNVLIVDMADKTDREIAHARLKRVLGEKYDVKTERGLIKIKKLFI